MLCDLIRGCEPVDAAEPLLGLPLAAMVAPHAHAVAALSAAGDGLSIAVALFVKDLRPGTSGRVAVRRR